MTTEIFADGACMNNGRPNAIGAWAAVIRHNGVTRRGWGPLTREKLGFPVTNNVAEMLAIKYGLQQIPAGIHDVYVYSDSQYSINALNGKNKSRANRQIVQDIQALVQGRGWFVHWSWVRGHAGHPENEECDQLARRELKRIMAL